MLFEFKKAPDGKQLDDKKWRELVSRGEILKPCEYKRR
jgi:ribosomal RNA-processing protein 8